AHPAARTNGEVVAQLAIARIRLRDAIRRLLVVSGRNRAAQVDVAVGNRDGNVRVGQRGLVAQSVLDLALQLVVAHTGGVNRSAGRAADASRSRSRRGVTADAARGAGSLGGRAGGRSLAAGGAA